MCSARASPTLSRGRVVASFALNNLRVKTAAVLYDVGNDYSRGLAEVFKATFVKGGGTVGLRILPEGRRRFLCLGYEGPSQGSPISSSSPTITTRPA